LGVKVLPIQLLEVGTTVRMLTFDKTPLVLGVCGGIAAYKACDLVRELQRRGGVVQPILSHGASEFVSPLTFSSLAMRPVTDEHYAVTSAGVPLHIDLAQWGKALIIYPATANMIAELAHGMATDLVNTTALCFTKSPIIIAPAMNVRMWENPLTQRNIETLKALPNIYVVEPSSGLLACGETGAGHLASAEAVLFTLYKALHPQAELLAGKRVLVTAGGTQEALDPARVLTNRSSGKMGLALADEAHAMGAEVTLVTANTQHASLERPYPIEVTGTAQHMYTAVMKYWPQNDWLIKAAAVSDFTPAHPHTEKIKKIEDPAHYVLELTPTRDILAEACAMKQPHQRVMGFAAESDVSNPEMLMAKLERKGCDVLAVNSITTPGLGFGSEDNAFTVYLHPHYEQTSFSLPKATKAELAQSLLSILQSISETKG
jgi:phosphopantothenoylcysteine decarboxylase / phosphopantothenate---cysteine ligase